MKKIVLILCIGFLTCQGASAQTDSNVTVTVKITNATPNGKDVTGDDVSLQLFHHNQEVGVLESKVNTEGNAVFTNVPVMPGFVARATAKHSNMTFNSPVLELIPLQTAFETKIDVYETSTDNSKLELGVHQIVIKKMSDKMLLITEYVQIVNSTGMAVTSEEKDESGRNKVIVFHLPDGFKNLTMTMYFVKNAIVETADGFYDTMATPPGKQLAAFSYTLDITADSMEIVRKISKPTKEFVVFSQLGAGNLQGAGTPAGEMTLPDGSPALYYSVSPCEKGSEVKLQLKGLATVQSAAGRSAEDKSAISPAIVIISVVLGIVVLVAIARAFVKKS